MIVICYDTGAGHTRRLAELIAEGAGPQAQLMSVQKRPNWDALHEAKAIIFGSPTYMGSASGRFKMFMDSTSDIWVKQLWQNKIAAGFTVGSSPSGDKLSTLSQMAIFAAQHGMIWVGQAELGQPTKQTDLNPEGIWLGLGATSSRDKAALIEPGNAETARRFGARITMAVERWG